MGKCSENGFYRILYFTTLTFYNEAHITIIIGTDSVMDELPMIFRSRPFCRMALFPKNFFPNSFSRITCFPNTILSGRPAEWSSRFTLLSITMELLTLLIFTSRLVRYKQNWPKKMQLFKQISKILFFSHTTIFLWIPYSLEDENIPWILCKNCIPLKLWFCNNASFEQILRRIFFSG